MSRIGQAGLGWAEEGKHEGGRREGAGQERRVSWAGQASWQKTPGCEKFGVQDDRKCSREPGARHPRGGLDGGESTWRLGPGCSRHQAKDHVFGDLNGSCVLTTICCVAACAQGKSPRRFLGVSYSESCRCFG